MPELEIMGNPHSNYVWVCRIACTEKGVPYTLVPVLPNSPEIAAIHPFRKIPAMRHGAVTLCESRAICAYIDRAFPGPALMPEGPVAHARVEQWISLVNTSIDPVCMRQYLVSYVFPRTPDRSPDRAAIEAALPGMERQIAVLAAAVAPTGHLVGAAFTLADAFLVPILHYLAQMPESGAMLAKAPGLLAYLERHRARPSLAETLPPPMRRR